MNSVRVALVVFSTVAVLVAVTLAHAQKPVQPAAVFDPAHDLVIGEPITHGDLSIFPVSSKTPRNNDRFITLDEGLKAGTVEIYEKGAAPTTNERRQVPVRTNE